MKKVLRKELLFIIIALSIALLSVYFLLYKNDQSAFAEEGTTETNFDSNADYYEGEENNLNGFVDEHRVDIDVKVTKNKQSENCEKEIEGMRSVDTYIQGTLQWRDDENNLHPLQRIKVSVYDSDPLTTAWLGTVFTNSSGYYSFGFQNDVSIFEGGYDLFIKVYAGDDDAYVSNANGDPYCWETGHDDHQNVSTGSTTTINYTFTMDSNLGKAMQISQPLMSAKDYAWDMIGEEPCGVVVKYPNGTGCTYSAANKSMSITGNAPQTGMPNAYACWDSIMKTYGRIIANDIGIYSIVSGSYNISNNIADDRDNKEEGIKLAWGGAWATTFALIAQQYNGTLSNISTVNGASFEAINASSAFNIDTTSTCLGEACERSVSAVLWDLFDSGSETNDSINLGYETWWNATTGGQADTFSGFIYYFYQQYSGYQIALGANLSYYKMAAGTISSPISGSALTTTPPTFSWTAQGGSISFPNNSFKLVFYDSEKTIPGISTSTVTSTTYTLTASEWASVLCLPGDTIYVGVKAQQTSSPTTGWYYSSVVSFTRPIYQVSDPVNDEVIIQGFYGGLEGDITIPSSIDGYTVVGIAAYAFQYRTFSSITLPSTIRTIGVGAFYQCLNLTEIDMEDTQVIVIEDSTFFYCTALENIYLPNSITNIGPYAFYYTQKNSYILSATVTTIGNNAFLGCTGTTIYTEHSSKPTGWSSTWNSSNRPVFWGCVLNTGKSYVTSFTKTISNPSNSGAVNGINNPKRSGYSFSGWYAESDYSGTQYMDVTAAPNGVLYAKWSKNSCVSAGSLITLADGSQVAVENLTGNESLLVWNMLTGQYDTAPILFIDSDPLSTYEVITLTFSDNTQVKVIYEHAFFDMTIGEYVFLRNDAAQYIGHYFNKKNGNTWTTVQLTNVSVGTEYTTAWSPVTYGHLCYYVNGMLSMPGATEGFINIFDVDTTLMQYEAEQMAEDIQTYGLYTYEEFNAIIPLPELVFNAFNGQYLKVSIGKGLITLSEIAELLEKYTVFFT